MGWIAVEKRIGALCLSVCLSVCVSLPHFDIYINCLSARHDYNVYSVEIVNVWYQI